MPKGVAKDAGGDSDKDALDVKDLRELVKAFENFKRDYRSDMRELKDSVSFCTDICNDVKGIAENIKQLRQEMHDIVNENKALKAENERLAQKCEELEQYQRLNNVEVKGVPVGDDPVLAMKKIGETVGEAVDKADLDTCHWTEKGQCCHVSKVEWSVGSSRLIKRKHTGTGSKDISWPYHWDIHRFLGTLPLHDERLAEEGGFNQGSPTQELLNEQRQLRLSLKQRRERKLELKEQQLQLFKDAAAMDEKLVSLPEALAKK
ncbi:hypothetical protein HPB50_002138 [Hyalomma asiaticum]|uniref:Uncharacterized protein n=1 Tax=Hyalomma asiaticum TaxID=266040 RepID=A0ACB7RNW9_HYAAI|nr:hypothetical protein HPB50_002138 [Hyalomma asiaticum]